LARWAVQDFVCCMFSWIHNILHLFLKNYNLKVQNEVQSMHWHNTQVTILVHIMYMLDPSYEHNNCWKVLKDVHYYIFDDNSHNTFFVQHCFMLHWSFLQEKRCYPLEHLVWSDGCGGQFKSSRAFYFVSQYSSLTRCEDLPNIC
jgi:hypothetical protein